MFLKSYCALLLCFFTVFFSQMPLWGADITRDLEGGDFFYSDPFIIYSAKKALYNDLYTGRFDFTVKSTEGAVELEGEVDSDDTLKRADQIVMKVPGVKSLDTRVTVNPALSYKNPMIADTDINEKVTEQIAKTKRVNIYRLESATIGGRVTLKGVVDSLDGELAALEVARSVRGVTSVRSAISIDSSVSDGYILFATKFLLLTDPRINGLKIHLDVKDGVIILRGTVKDEESRDLAINKARGVAGSTGVISYLKVGEVVFLDEEKVADDTLAKTVEDALKNDEDLKSFDIKVTALDGVVTLKGTVDGKETVVKAIEKVSSINGVRAVKSELETE